MGNPAKLRRIVELFEEGEPLDLGEPGRPEWVYVRKPNAFEHDEAIEDGRAARALYLERHAPGQPARASMEAAARAQSDAELVEALVLSEGVELYFKARDEVRGRKEWQDRLVLLDRAPVLEESASDEEREALDRVYADFSLAVAAEQERSIGALRREMEAEVKKDRESLERRWVEAWLKNGANQEFLDARRQTEVFFSLRDVEMEEVDGEFKVKLIGDPILERREQVRTLPDKMLARIIEVLDKQMTPEEAGNSAAPTASSSPSEQPRKQEGSARSSRKGTSRAPVGTSSTRSTRR